MTDLYPVKPEFAAKARITREQYLRDYQASIDDPDAFYARHGSNLGGLKRWLFAHVVRHWMNDNVARVRAGRW